MLMKLSQFVVAHEEDRSYESDPFLEQNKEPCCQPGSSASSVDSSELYSNV